MTNARTPPSGRITAEEWALLADAPVLAAMMIPAADRRGNVRGTLAVAREYPARTRPRPRTLPRPSSCLVPLPDGRTRTRERDALARDAPTALRTALAVLAREASDDDRADYARLVPDVAAAAAGAGGGERAAALNQITAIVEEDHHA